MAGKVLYGLLALVACTRATFFPGMDGYNPLKNVPFMGGQNPFSNSGSPSRLIPVLIGPAANNQRNPLFNNNPLNRPRFDGNPPRGSPPQSYEHLIQSIPGSDMLLHHLDHIPSFPSINNLISKIWPNGSHPNDTKIVVPMFPKLPEIPQYIPGLYEATREARKHVQALLNITTDIDTGLRQVMEASLNSQDPASGVTRILETITKVYSTVAANCPFIIVGTRIYQEGMQLSWRVMQSLANIALGKRIENDSDSFDVPKAECR